MSNTKDTRKYQKGGRAGKRNSVSRTCRLVACCRWSKTLIPIHQTSTVNRQPTVRFARLHESLNNDIMSLCLTILYYFPSVLKSLLLISKRPFYFLCELKTNYNLTVLITGCKSLTAQA